MNTNSLSPDDLLPEQGTPTPLQTTLVYAASWLVLLGGSRVVLPALVDGYDAGGLAVTLVEVCLTAGLVYLLTSLATGEGSETNGRYRALIETSPAPVNLFDGDGTVVWGNDAVLDLLDLDDREALVGRSIFEFIAPDDEALARSELTAVVEEGESTGPTAMELRTDEDERRRIRVSTAPGRYGGERVGQAVVIDDTRLRAVEEALRSERDFIRDSLDQLRDLFFVVDADGRLERWNARVPEVTGYDADELDGKPVGEFFAPADRGVVDETLERTFEEGSSFLEADVVTSEGEHRRFEFRGATVDASGEGDRVVGIARDVTDRRRMERERRENEQRYRTLVEMSPHSKLVHRDGEIVYANDAFVDLVGADSRDEVLGSHLNAFVPPADHDEVAAVAERTQRGDAEPTKRRRTVVGTDGTEHFIETTSRRISYENEPAVLTTVEDVSHRHRFEEMLETLHERTHAMTRAETREETAGIAAETVFDLIDVAGCAVYTLGDGDELEPLARSGFDSVADEPVANAGSGVLWEAFVDGTERTAVVEGDVEGLADAGTRSILVLPLGNHGVIALVAGPDWSPSTSQRRIFDLVAESLDATFDRFEREQDLRERDRRLERQNEALEQLNRLNEIIREINQTLVRSTTRAEILRQTCEQLTGVEQYSFAWVGSRDSSDGPTDPQYWAGIDPEYVDQIGSSADVSPVSRLAEAAVRENDVQVARDVLDDSEWRSARSEVISYGFRSVAAVPIGIGEYVEAVLVVHAHEPDIFDEQERAVLAELGRTIGYALRTVRGSVGSESRTEIELSIADDRLVTNRIATELDTTVEFEGVITRENDGLQLFLDLGDVSEDVVERLAALETVTEVRPLSTGDDEGLYHVTVSDSPLLTVLSRRGAHIRTLTASDGISTLVCVLPGGVAVRPVVAEIESVYLDTDLIARREGVEPVETRAAFHERLLDELTDRQREAFETAAYSGFYEWPRRAKSKELAALLDIAPSTYQYHLRAAERTMVNAVLEPASAADI